MEETEQEEEDGSITADVGEKREEKEKQEQEENEKEKDILENSVASEINKHLMQEDEQDMNATEKEYQLLLLRGDDNTVFSVINDNLLGCGLNKSAVSSSSNDEVVVAGTFGHISENDLINFWDYEQENDVSLPEAEILM